MIALIVTIGGRVRGASGCGKAEGALRPPYLLFYS